MADITETLSVSKIYSRVWGSENKTELTGATVSAVTAITGFYPKTGAYGETTGNYLELVFDLLGSAYAASRKLVSDELAVWISGKSASGDGATPSGDHVSTGPLPSGSFDGYLWPSVDPQKPGFEYHIRTNREGYRFEDLSAGKRAVGSYRYARYLQVGAGVQDGYYNNLVYSVTATLSIQGAAGANPPTVTAVWQEITPKLTGLSPAAGAFVDEKADAVFRWSYSAEPSYSGAPTTQNGGKLEWRLTGDSTIHTVTFTGAVDSVTLPAGTIPSSSTGIDYRVTVKTCHGVSATSDWITCTTVDTAPEAPTQLSPANAIVQGDDAAVFAWHHNAPTGSAQSAAELQRSTDSGATWSALASVSGSAQQCTIAAGTLPTSSVRWRVRTSNSDGAAGPWSEGVDIIVRARPAAPIISSVTATPRPTVTWQSSAQIGYRVTFETAEGIAYDTGERYGAVKSVRCPQFLPDGPSTITVAIVNAVGLWASTSAQITVANEPGGEIDLQALPQLGACLLKWASTDLYDQCYVLRNGEPVAKTTNTQWLDRAASGVNEYVILGVQGDNYTQSAVVSGESRIRSCILFDAEADGPFVYLYKHKASPPEISRELGATVTYQHFAGQTYPTAFATGARDQTSSMSFTIASHALPVLAKLVGKVVCVKDRGDAAYYAVLDSVSQSVWKRTDVQLKLTRVEYRETVDYE